MPPSSFVSRQIFESVPACGTMPEKYCSAPDREERHWKNKAPSEPLAMWPRLFRISSRGAFERLTGCHVPPLVECSMSSHGSRFADIPRMRSPEKAMSWAEWGSVGIV